MMTIEEFRSNYLQGAVRSNQTNQDTPFFDQAETHTYSDWLVPYVYGVGVEDLEEYYLGGLPDLSTFLVRESNAFKLDAKEFANLNSKNLTKFGSKLKKLIRKKNFIDLGCGQPTRSVIPRLLAQAFGARMYIGVDLFHVKEQVVTSEFPFFGPGFLSVFIQEDLLKFVKQYQFSGPSVFLIAGVERKNRKNLEEQFPYVVELLEALNRITKSGDIVILGAGTPDLDLDRKLFTKIYGDQYQEVYKRKTKLLFTWFR